MIVRNAGLLVLVQLIVSCSDLSKSAAANGSTVQITGKTTTLQLPKSPTALALSGDFAAMTPALLKDVSEDVGYATDVALMADKQFAVLDRIEAQIVIYDSTGTKVRTVGRHGYGPHEMQSPMALEAVSNGFVVLDRSQHATLVFVPLGTDSSAAAVRALHVDGDFANIVARGPVVFFNANVGEGPEDPTRRLRSGADGSIWLQAQDNPTAQSTVRVTVSQYQSPGDWTRVTPTWSLNTAPATPHGPKIEYDVHTRHSYWAVGSDWSAVSTSESSNIHVRYRDSTLFIVWPIDTATITRSQHIETARWLADYTVMFDKQARDAASAMPAAEMDKALEGFASSLHFATPRPALGALMASDKCVFAAGWNSRDSRDGTSLSWTGVPIRDPVRLVRFKLPHADSRVRDMRGGRIAVTRLDSIGRSIIEIYPMPARC